MVRRAFTEAQRRRILADADANGVAAASKKNRVVESLIYRWRKATETVKSNGAAANDAHDPVPALNDQITRLQTLLTQAILKPGSVELVISDFREVKQ